MTKFKQFLRLIFGFFARVEKGDRQILKDKQNPPLALI